MKKLTLATLSTLALTLASSSVFATDGTITINGVITDGTCTLQGDDGKSTGLKDITINLPSAPKSIFEPAYLNPMQVIFSMQLTNAAGTGACDAATTKAFKGIHLSPISPDHLDVEDKTLLVNQATGASSTNPLFVQFLTRSGILVDFSAPWGTQATSQVFTIAGNTYVSYRTAFASKTGIVDAQNVQAKINYTLHYN